MKVQLKLDMKNHILFVYFFMQVSYKFSVLIFSTGDEANRHESMFASHPPYKLYKVLVWAIDNHL